MIKDIILELLYYRVIITLQIYFNGTIHISHCHDITGIFTDIFTLNGIQKKTVNPQLLFL